MSYNIICNRTGADGNLGGILQVIPQVFSRDQLGKGGARTLLQHFLTSFGSMGSVSLHRAQLCFARSLAASAIVCYLLQIKDRHNGNILFDNHGHLIHIDFGFILGISPGHNMGFEAAPFKLSQEMIDVMGGTTSTIFKHFKVLTIHCFLAARKVMHMVCALVASFADADLPCFQYRPDVLHRLRRRFVPEMGDVEAAAYMADLVDAAVKDWTSSIYDGVQKLQNNIYSPEWK
jgi:phosphatidylinositol 4-kinase